MKKNIKANNKPIGIFDSGVGGLTVLKEVSKLMPSENIVYFGDTARVPYGNKSSATVKKFSVDNVLFLLEQDVKIVIIACNTSSALALGYLKSFFRVPIIGVIDAGVKKILAGGKNRAGVIGTKSTIESKSYQKALALYNKKIKVFAKSCPLFVPLIEEGLTGGVIAKETVQFYLKSLKKKQIDTLTLGCTHYPLLVDEIINFLPGVNIIDSACEVARETKLILEKLKLKNKNKVKGKIKLFVSDESANFMKLAKLFLKKPISKPKKVDV